MEKRGKCARLVYYTGLIVAIVVMACAIFITSDGSEEDNIRVSNLRYMIAFYSFLGIISPCVLVREFLLGKYDIKRYRLKIVIVAVSLVVGTLLWILAPIPALISFVFMASLLAFIFVLTPSNKANK